MAEPINHGENPNHVIINDEGATFRLPNGDKAFLGPKESMKIQHYLGADIIFAFDECTAPLVSYKYAEKSLSRTHAWAKICLEAHPTKSKQALYGIVQGSSFKDLREVASNYINSLGFSGFGIGGDLGKTKEEMSSIVGWVTKVLDESKPRHLLGIGYLEDIERIVKLGIDTFDCTVPTHYGRR